MCQSPVRDSWIFAILFIMCVWVVVVFIVWRFVWLKFGYNDAAVEFNKLPAVLNVFAQP
jgi:hypothetical protein